jgi:hypothetical protein
LLGLFLIWNDFSALQRPAASFYANLKFGLFFSWPISTFIHTSPIIGSFAVVATLLELGADIRARNAAGNTPAHTAALNGHVEAMEEFMSSGFDVKTTNGRGQTVLHLAAVATKVPIHQCCGSGSGIRCFFDPESGIQNRFFSGCQTHIFESLVTMF